LIPSIDLIGLTRVDTEAVNYRRLTIGVRLGRVMDHLRGPRQLRMFTRSAAGNYALSQALT